MSRYSPSVLPNDTDYNDGGRIAQALAAADTRRQQQQEQQYRDRASTIEHEGTVDPIPAHPSVLSRIGAAIRGQPATPRGDFSGMAGAAGAAVDRATSAPSWGDGSLVAAQPAYQPPRGAGPGILPDQSTGHGLDQFIHPFAGGQSRTGDALRGPRATMDARPGDQSGGQPLPMTGPSQGTPLGGRAAPLPGQWIPETGTFHMGGPSTPGTPPQAPPAAPPSASPYGGPLPPSRLAAQQGAPPVEYAEWKPGMRLPTHQSVQRHDEYVADALAQAQAQHDQAMNYSVWQVAHAQHPETVGEFSPGVPYAKLLPDYLTAAGKQAEVGEQARDHDLQHTDRQATVGATVLGHNLTYRVGAQNAATNAGELAERTRHDRELEKNGAGSILGYTPDGQPILGNNKTFQQTHVLADEYHGTFPIQNADKAASNANLALQAIAMARQGNRAAQSGAITGYLRLTHPDAVVRTNDKGMLIEAQGVPAEVQMQLRRWMGQGGLITPQGLDEMEQGVHGYVRGLRQSIAPTQAYFGQRARAAGLDSAQVARDPLAGIDDGPMTALQQKWDAAAAHLRQQGKPLDVLGPRP